MPRLVSTLALSLLLVSSATSLSTAEDLNALSRLSATFETIADKVRPTVVEILASGYAVPEDESSRGATLLAMRRAVGSGVIIDPRGYIVTNAHVATAATRLQVVLGTPLPGAPIGSILRPRGKVLPAVVVGVDQETDLAVLKIEERELPFLELGDSDGVKQGQRVLAFGSPMGLENSVSMGIVSAVAR